MKIFLGYPSERLAEAQEVYDFLKTINDDVWFDKKSLTGGDDWDRERAEAQTSADFIIHLVSREIFARPGVVNREIRQTLKQVEDQPFGVTYVLFVRLDEIRLPVEFLRFQYVDFPREDWREEIAQAVAKRIGQLGGAIPRITSDKTVIVQQDDVSSSNRIPSSRVETSTTTEHYMVSADYLQYSGRAVYWDFVNAKLASEALAGFFGAVADFKLMDDDDKLRVLTYGAPFEWSINMQEFFQRGEILSIRSSIFWYGGGVHPSHTTTTLNFLGSEAGHCTIEDLLGNDESSAIKLLAYCKKVLLAMFDGEDMDDFLNRSFDDPANVWTLSEQFSLDDRGVTINFSPYEVLPYAFGSQEVLVPWRFMEHLIDDRYRGFVDQIRE